MVWIVWQSRWLTSTSCCRIKVSHQPMALMGWRLSVSLSLGHAWSLLRNWGQWHWSSNSSLIDSTDTFKGIIIYIIFISLLDICHNGTSTLPGCHVQGRQESGLSADGEALFSNTRYPVLCICIRYRSLWSILLIICSSISVGVSQSLRCVFAVRRLRVSCPVHGLVCTYQDAILCYDIGTVNITKKLSSGDAYHLEVGSWQSIVLDFCCFVLFAVQAYQEGWNRG